MFVAPLSIRNNLNFLSKFAPRRSKSVVMGDTLHMLLWDEEYLELVTVPLLGQDEERSVVKALFVADAAMCAREEVLHIYAITNTALYCLVNGMDVLTETEHSFASPEISICGENVVVFSNNTFYLFDGLCFRNLHISPYFRTIRSYCMCPSTDAILYQTETYTSIYTAGGRTVLRKHPCVEDMFLSDGKLFIHREGVVLVHEVSRDLRPVARIDTNIKIQAEWRHLQYRGGMLYMSGVFGDGYVLYVDGYLFSTEDLVQSFELYTNCFFGTGSGCLYFLPNDKDFDLRLLGSESKLLNSVLSGGPVSYVCRTFEFSGREETGTCREAKIGYFLSILVYHGFRVECRKLICRELNEMQRGSGSVERLRILDEASRFGYKIHRVFMDMRIDVHRIYGRVTEIIDPDIIDRDLLVRMTEITFRDIDFLDSPRYLVLKGRQVMKCGGDFMEWFYRCTGMFDKVVRMLEDADKVVELVLLWRNVGFCSGTSFEKMCRYNLAHFVHNGGVSGREVMECLCEMWAMSSNRYEKVGCVVEFIDGRYDLLMGFSLQELLRPFLSQKIVERCYSVPGEIESSLDFLLSNGVSVAVSMLYYHRFRRTGNREYLDRSLENIHDNVFVYGGEFVGRETLYELVGKEDGDEEDYRHVLLGNVQRIREMDSGVVWTEVMRAEECPDEYKEYLEVLEERSLLRRM